MSEAFGVLFREESKFSKRLLGKVSQLRGYVPDPIEILENMSKARFIEISGDVLLRNLRNPSGDQRIDIARSNREIFELGIGE